METFKKSIVLVSGLPRSGTSLAMQLLEAAELPLFTDGKRIPDEHNPRGYFEHAQILTLPQNSAWLSDVRGHGLKVIHALIPFLPDNEHYKIIFMNRSLHEVVESQSRMLKSLGRSGGLISQEKLVDSLHQEVQRCKTWMSSQPNISVLELSFSELIFNPKVAIDQILCFLAGLVDNNERVKSQMMACIRSELYRNRMG